MSRLMLIATAGAGWVALDRADAGLWGAALAAALVSCLCLWAAIHASEGGRHE